LTMPPKLTWQQYVAFLEKGPPQQNGASAQRNEKELEKAELARLIAIEEEKLRLRRKIAEEEAKRAGPSKLTPSTSTTSTPTTSTPTTSTPTPSTPTTATNQEIESLKTSVASRESSQSPQPTRPDARSWTPAEIIAWCDREGLGPISAIARESEWDGFVLFALYEAILQNSFAADCHSLEISNSVVQMKLKGRLSTLFGGGSSSS